MTENDNAKFTPLSNSEKFKKEVFYYNERTV